MSSQAQTTKTHTVTAAKLRLVSLDTSLYLFIRGTAVLVASAAGSTFQLQWLCRILDASSADALAERK